MIIYFIVFLSCAFLGWVLEVFYRSYKKKFVLVNPGFLKGPYLPIYGFGGIILFLLSDFFSGKNIFLSFFAYFFILTLLEFITGLIFENYFKTKLWDYSDKKFNLKAIVCLEFSIYWSILGLFFQVYLYPFFLKISGFNLNNFWVAFLGFCYGIICIDAFQSFKLAYKIRSFVKEFAQNLKNKRENNKIYFQELIKEFEKNNKLKMVKKDFLKNIILRLNIFFRLDTKELKNYFDEFIKKYKEKNDQKNNL